MTKALIGRRNTGWGEMAEERTTPAHEGILAEWAEHSYRHATIVDFLEWCSQRGLELEVFDHATAAEHFPTLDSMKPDRLAFTYLDIDPRALEDARQSLLDSLTP